MDVLLFTFTASRDLLPHTAQGAVLAMSMDK
jgi:hypothetical protein